MSTKYYFEVFLHTFDYYIFILFIVLILKLTFLFLFSRLTGL